MGKEAKFSIIEFLRSDGSIVVNKKLAWAIGINASILYSELVSRQDYFRKKGELDKEGYFFNTIEDLQAGTCLTKYEQRLAIKRLIKSRLLAVKRCGFRNKRYFKIKCGKVAEKTLKLLLLKDYVVGKKSDHSKEKEAKKALVGKKSDHSVGKKSDHSSNNTNLNNKKREKEREKDFFTKKGIEEKKEKEYIPGSLSVDEQILILREKGHKI